jgi:transcriptional regulator with XRE-family HTH domain
MPFQKGECMSTMYAEALKTIRLYHRMTQTQVAGIVGIQGPLLSAIENGEKMPQLHTLENYADWLVIPLSSLIAFAEAIDSPTGLTPVMHKKLVKILSWALEASEA